MKHLQQHISHRQSFFAEKEHSDEGLEEEAVTSKSS